LLVKSMGRVGTLADLKLRPAILLQQQLISGQEEIEGRRASACLAYGTEDRLMEGVGR